MSSNMIYIQTRPAAGSGDTDPFTFGNFEGEEGSSPLFDENGTSIIWSGARLTRVEPLSGKSSIQFDGVPGQVVMLSRITPPYLKDFTVELEFSWEVAQGAIFDTRPPGGSNTGFFTVYYGAGKIHIHKSGGDVASSVSVNPALNTKHHFAVTQKDGVVRMFLNGTKISETYGIGGFDMNVMCLAGNSWSPGIGPHFKGKMDSYRYTLGTALYVDNFVPT